MSTAALTKPITFHESILDWSKTRPVWQRDALRRLVEKQKLDDADLDDLVAICKSECGLLAADEACPTPQPLARDHLPTSETVGDDVCIEAICSVKHVNRLAQNQELTFGTTGLTIGYGDNGAGKTGYSRIIKRACRARNRGARIKPDIYKDDPKQPATAKIKYFVGGRKHETQWIDGQAGPAELSAVSYFDSECATTHISEANDIAFTPFGLDLLESLVQACDRVKERLNLDKRKLDAEKPASLQKPKFSPTTRVGRLLASLTYKSKPGDFTALANITPEEQHRRQQFKADLAADPLKSADQIKTRCRRIETLNSLVVSARQTLSVEAATEAKRLSDDFTAKQEAASLAATTLFSGDPLPDIGGDAWRALWNAARRYSETAAYPGQEFPVTDDAARCGLCQQELGADAQERFRRFDRFVKDNAEQAAREAESKLKQAFRRLQELDLRPDSYRDQLAEVRLENDQLAARIRQSLVLLRLRRRSLLNALETKSWGGIHEMAEYPEAEVAVLIATLTDRETTLRKSLDPKHRAQLESALQELDDRVWLNEHLDDVLDEISRLGSLEILNSAMKTTVATQITKKNTALADEFVTNRLRDCFANEIERLHINKVRVELQAAGGERGTSRYQIRFISAPHVPLGDVLSEGEHRAIALAGFMAELATSPTKSALVFDDPVSSLDHKWRNQVARRLVEEAQHRQVIVFTHDIVFLYDLLDFARRKKVERQVQQISRGADGIGTIGNVLPWKAQLTWDRIKVLKQKCHKARGQYDADNEAAYEKTTTRIYDGLRATVEKAIEEFLFCGVVMRHRDYIDTKWLKRTSVIERGDCELLRELFKRCSEITGAHDPSSGRNSAAPIPDEVQRDIDRLADWVKNITKRQKAVS